MDTQNLLDAQHNAINRHAKGKYWDLLGNRMDAIVAFKHPQMAIPESYPILLALIPPLQTRRISIISPYA